VYIYHHEEKEEYLLAISYLATGNPFDLDKFPDISGIFGVIGRSGRVIDYLK